jgi:hypothetical protein
VTGITRPWNFVMWHFAERGNIISGTGNVVYTFGVSEATRFRPYVIGGIGLYYADPDDPGIPGIEVQSSTDFGLNGGAGFTAAVGQGSARLFAEARFHTIFEGDNVNLLPITIGVMFGGP